MSSLTSAISSRL